MFDCRIAARDTAFEDVDCLSKLSGSLELVLPPVCEALESTGAALGAACGDCDRDLEPVILGLEPVVLGLRPATCYQVHDKYIAIWVGGSDTPWSPTLFSAAAMYVRVFVSAQALKALS